MLASRRPRCKPTQGYAGEWVSEAARCLKEGSLDASGSGKHLGDDGGFLLFWFDFLFSGGWFQAWVQGMGRFWVFCSGLLFEVWGYED